MMERIKSVEIVVRGKRHEWSFSAKGSEQDIQEWRDDGLEVITVYHQIPDWVVSLGLTKVYCLLDDLLTPPHRR